MKEESWSRFEKSDSVSYSSIVWYGTLLVPFIRYDDI